MLFNRVVSIEIQTTDKLFTIENLYIDFTVIKTLNKEPNTADIVVYNLSNESIKNIKKNSKITISAYFKDTIFEKVIFNGEIASVHIVRDGRNVKAILTCIDGLKTYQSDFVSISFDKNTSCKSIIKNIIAQKKLPIENNLDSIAINDFFYKTGYSFIGKTINALEELCNNLKIDISIQNGKVFFSKKDKDVKNILVVSLDYESGLIGYPQRVSTQKTDTGKKNELDGWQVTSLLNPNIECGKTIKISSIQTGQNVLLKCVSLEHLGSNYAGDFITIFEAI